MSASDAAGHGELAVGARVLARVKHDRLFYAGSVVELEPAGPAGEACVTVLYDDDGEESTIPVGWVVPGDERPVIFGPAGATGVLVTEGWLWKGTLQARVQGDDVGPRKARLLSFVGAPKVYQSGVIVSTTVRGGDDVDDYDWNHLFDPEQALALALAFVVPASTNTFDCRSSGSVRAHGDRDEMGSQRVALIGGGGATLTMGLRAALGPTVMHDVVELDQAVLEAAHTHFGLPEDSADIRVHCGNGLDFLKNVPKATYDAILIDVCPANSEDDAALEFPAIEFVDPAFLQQGVKRSLKPGGMVAMNAIGDAVNLAKITYTFKVLFGNVHVLATDPNYYFYAKSAGPNPGDLATWSVSPREVQLAADASGLATVAQDVLVGDVGLTAHYRDEETLIGWLGSDEFLDRVTREVV